MRPVISRLLLLHQGDTTTATLVALVSGNLVSGNLVNGNLVNLATTANNENHVSGIHETSEDLRLLGSSKSLLHPESTVNLQQIGSTASHHHPKNHLDLGW
jgi:hypothetical protein